MDVSDVAFLDGHVDVAFLDGFVEKSAKRWPFCLGQQQVRVRVRVKA